MNFVDGEVMINFIMVSTLTLKAHMRVHLLGRLNFCAWSVKRKVVLRIFFIDLLCATIFNEIEPLFRLVFQLSISNLFLSEVSKYRCRGVLSENHKIIFQLASRCTDLAHQAYHYATGQ